MKKKVIALVLVLVFSISLFSACGSKTESTETGNGEEVGTGQISIPEIATKGTNKFGWDIPEETIKLEYYYKKQANPDKEDGYNDMLRNYLLDEFNVEINKIVYDTNPEERFSLMLASGDYPAVMTRMTKSDVLRLDQLGILVDMAPYIEEYGDDIKKELGDLYPRYVDDQGKILGLPYGWGMLEIPDYSAHIRNDVYEAMGSPAFETPEEYYAILKQMISDNPTNSKGEKVYAMSWNDRVSMITSINTIAGIWGLKEGYKEDADNNLTHWINTPEGKEFTAFYNQIHRDGLFDPDAFTNKYDDWKSKFSNERIIGHIGPWWQSWNAGHEVWQKTNDNWTEDQRFVQVKLKAAGAEAAYLSPKDTTGWGYTVITDKAENPAELVKLFDFMMTPNGTRLMSWGVPDKEGSNWNVAEDGSWSFVEEAKQGIIDATYDYEAHKYFGDNQYWLVHPQGAMSDDPTVNTWIDQCFNDESKWKKVLNENMAGTIYDSSAISQIAFLPDDNISIIKQQVEDTISSTWAKTVLSNTPEDFEENYETMIKQLDKAGVNELQAYMTEQYKINLDKWK